MNQINNKPRRIAAILTEYRPNSHADVIVTKFLKGFPTDEGLMPPRTQIASLYIDQFPDADIVFMKHHGVMVLANGIAEAWDDLYYLERACQVQVLAMSTGRPIVPVDPAVAAATHRQMRDEDTTSARLHLDSIKRQLDAQEPDYRR